MGVTLGSLWGQPRAGIHIDNKKQKKRKVKREREMLRRRSSNAYCPHNGVLCREEDLTLSAVCSTCAQAHLAHDHLPLTSTSNKDKIDTTSTSSSMKLKSKRVVFVVPPLSEPEHHAVLAEE